MDYEEIKLLKQSEKSTVYQVREKDGETTFVRKVLKGDHPIYSMLQNCDHPYLPKIYEVEVKEGMTTVIEEFVEGQPLGCAELSEKQLIRAIKELCTVLSYLHGKDIIHRDIKPSNLILAKDGHIRLIDFDAARMPKEDLEQDTRLLGTRGYAPPEQYGFAQTDERADIYALGITMKQLLGDQAGKARYWRIIKKCTNLNPDHRYQSAEQVKRALTNIIGYALCGIAVLLVCVIIWWMNISDNNSADSTSLEASSEKIQEAEQESDLQEEFGEEVMQEAASDENELIELPAPENPHWNGETGTATWGNVPESGGEMGVSYTWKIYRSDTDETPNMQNDQWISESGMTGNGNHPDNNFPEYTVNMADALDENGYYFFAVAACGDDITYADSSYVLSDAFEYKGADAPVLPAPDVKWLVANDGNVDQYYAAVKNLGAYAEEDTFNAWIFNESGDYVHNNVWTRADIEAMGHEGIWIGRDFLTGKGSKFRIAMEVYSSEPNEYKSWKLSEEIPEEAYSEWVEFQ